MILFHDPTTREIEAFLEAQRSSRFSYPEVGATRKGAPPYYKVDHNRVRLGTGEEAFKIAVAAMRQWKMFDLGWVRIACHKVASSRVMKSRRNGRSSTSTCSSVECAPPPRAPTPSSVGTP